LSPGSRQKDCFFFDPDRLILENPNLTFGFSWNAAQFARSLSASEVTARRYLDILSGAYMVRILPPWYQNIGKRQLKAPKIYIRDSGILHGLLQLGALADLQAHPEVGAS
jgi:uncharacterized protein